MSRETLEVPARVREAVYARDNQCCRVCGRHADIPGLHHIAYRSEGGLHVVENLITIGWTPSHDCHLAVVHRSKRLWQPILEAVIAGGPGLNARQVLRWAREQERKGDPSPVEENPIRVPSAFSDGER